MGRPATLDELQQATHLLARSISAQRRLTEVALDSGGLSSVLELLAQLIERDLVVDQSVAPPFRVATADRDGAAAMELAIVGGGEELGTLHVLDEPPARADLPILEHGVSLLAGELLRARTAQEVEWRLGGELLVALVQHGGPLDRRLAERASRLGIDLSLPHRALVLEACDCAVSERDIRLCIGALPADVRAPSLLTRLGPQRLLLLCQARDDRALERMLAALREATGATGRVAIGVSRAGTDLSRSLRESLACARFACLSGQAHASVRADRLGPLRFVFAVDDPQPLRDYVQEQLDPLLNDGRGSELLRTLRAFLETDGRLQVVGSLCHIHKSTVKYRMGQIGRLLGRTLSDPRVRFELRLAFAVSDALEGLGQPTPLAGFAAAV